MKPYCLQQNTNSRPCAIRIRISSMFVLYFTVLMTIVLGYAIWFAWTFLERFIFSGKLLRHYMDFQNKSFHDQIGCFFIPLGFIIPLLLAATIVYLLVISFRAYYSKSSYYMVFSKNGTDMAGCIAPWNSMTWFGAKKTVFGNGVIPCWIIRGAHRNAAVWIYVPSIKPISSELFTKLCDEVRKRYPNQTKHLDSLSWGILDFDKDLSYKYQVITILPNPSKQTIDCDVINSV